MNAIRPWLFVGSYQDARNPGLLHSRGIGAMLLLAKDIRHLGINTKYLPIEDAEPLPGLIIREGVDFILEEKRLGRNVLVACGAGISRSVTFAIAALKEDEGTTLSEALQTVKERRPEAEPHPTLWRSMCEYYR